MEGDSVEILVHASARCRADDDKRFRKEAAAILDFLDVGLRDFNRSCIGRDESAVNHTAHTLAPGHRSSKPTERNKANELSATWLSSQTDLTSSLRPQVQVNIPQVQKVQVAETPILSQIYGSQVAPRKSSTSFGHKGSSAIKETPVVAIARTPYANTSAWRHHPNAAETTCHADTSSEVPTRGTPSTPPLPSTVPESASPHTKSPDAPPKRKLLSLDSTPSVIEESPRNAKRIHMEDGSKRWPNESNVSPSLRKHPPLGEGGSSKRSPGDRLQAKDTRFDHRRQRSLSPSQERSSERRSSPKLLGTKSSTVCKNQSEATEAASKAVEPREATKCDSRSDNETPASSFHQNIYPLLPDTEDGPFVTHNVQTLKWVSTNAQLSARYKPIGTPRDINPFERGYWKFTARHWSPQVRTDFIEYLEELIGRGKAGFGTWLEVIRANARGYHELRVWCWGEVVKEVWLAMHLQLKNSVEGMTLSWVDSNGKVVVKMP